MEAGVLPKDKKLETRKIKYEGKEIEVNVFCEDPLIVGEVTAFAETDEEIRKLIEKIDIARRIYDREPAAKVFVANVISRKVFDKIMSIVKEHGIIVIYGSTK